MAKTPIKRTGFGQVEANHLSMQRTGQMHAQLPAKADITQLENGQFAKYDVASGEVNFSTEATSGEWYMVFNEVKLYGDRYDETYKDYAMQKKNFTEGEMTPRLVKINIGDLYTTNCLGSAGVYRAETAGLSLDVNDILVVGPNGYLVEKTGGVTGDGFELTVVKVYTMPDGQPGVKLMRTK